MTNRNFVATLVCLALAACSSSTAPPEVDEPTEAIVTVAVRDAISLSPVAGAAVFELLPAGDVVEFCVTDANGRCGVARPPGTSMRLTCSFCRLDGRDDVFVFDVPPLSAPLLATFNRDRVLFFEDFEGSFAASGWQPQPGLVSSGVHVPDPYDAANGVLGFTDMRARGDAFSRPIPLGVGARYELWFDFLGLPGPGVPESDGYIGIADEYPGAHVWLGTTDSNTAAYGPEAVRLHDDGVWRRYIMPIDPAALIGGSDGFFQLMLEDGDGGVPLDAFFDNLVVTVRN